MEAKDFELGKRLAEILMPYAWKRRQDFVVPGGRFVHYTSAAAGLSIIKNRSLWMRNTTCMADYSEVQHGITNLVADHFFPKLIETLDQALSGSGTEARGHFDRLLADTQFGTFISSISEHDREEDAHGRLSMWRAFAGGSTARVAFVLKLPVEATVGSVLNIAISPVAYFRAGQLSLELLRVISNVKNNRDFLNSVERPRIVASIFMMLVFGAVCMKHEGFHEEREWRVVYNPKRQSSPLMRYDVETVAGVPQLVYKLPLCGGPPDEMNDISIANMLDRLIIGPSQFPWAMYEAFVDSLAAIGVENAAQKVFVSGIPLRG